MVSQLSACAESESCLPASYPASPCHAGRPSSTVCPSGQTRHLLQLFPFACSSLRPLWPAELPEPLLPAGPRPYLPPLGMGESGVKYPDLPLQPTVSSGVSQKSSETAQFRSYQGVFSLAYNNVVIAFYCDTCVVKVEFHKY